MFPVINNLDELRRAVEHMPEIRFTTNEDGFTIVCYMISTGETFTAENKHWARECRGITFYPDGKIASRPLHKFFNIGELEETQMHKIEWKNVRRVMDKRDGSMVHPVRVNGKVLLKTKKSFYSDVALLATDILHSPGFEHHLAFCEKCVDAEITPIFEFTVPHTSQWRIVLPYEQYELRLLHIRSNISGEYFENPRRVVELMGDLIIPCVDEYDIIEFDEEVLKKSMDEDANKEGYVIYFNNGMMVKGKTQWYLQLHQVVVFVRERDIAEMVINETVDDYKSFLALAGTPLDRVNAIEHRVLVEVHKIESAATEAYMLIKDQPDAKSAALLIRGHPMFAAAMKMYRCHEYDVKDHFLKYVLKEQFSLEQV